MLQIATMSSTTSDDPGLDALVRELRGSSRRLVRVLGFLNTSIEAADCTPAQCHALIELAAQGQLRNGELAELLEIDKSTASRTLKPLLRAGLLEQGSEAGDRRGRSLRLSAAGLERVQRIHAAADAEVRGALGLLSAEERQVVLRGVALYEQALHRAKARAGIVFRSIERRDDPALAGIIRSVMSEFGAVGSGFSIEDPEVDAMSRTYSQERCAYFVAEREGELIAGGGIAPLAGGEADVCELRKMYALMPARGLGVGRRLLELCLEAARAEGFRACYLETLRHMHRARALYEKAGFRPLDGPLGATGHHGCDSWYALEL